MTVRAGISVNEGKLMVLGHVVLDGVGDDIVITPASGSVGALIHGAFIGVRSNQKGSRRVFPIGKLEGLRFISVFRYKFWWMTQWMGNSGKEIPSETQFLLVEAYGGTHLDKGSEVESDDGTVYTVFLPILEGDFRAVLQGNEKSEVEICLESGDPATDEFEGSHLVFVAAGLDPFDVISCAVKTVERHLQSFSHLERKKLPDLLNWFGWCTWDAFYTTVSADGVKQGLESFRKGRIAPKFVIIDDGWQSVDMDPSAVGFIADDTANFANRLTHIKENHKFLKDGKEGQRVEDELGLRYIVNEIKKEYGLKYVYVWHAITGYWGGLKVSGAEMADYEPKLVYPVPSPGVLSNHHCEVLKNITLNGVSLVNPEKVFNFFNELHSYLASAGINGVKVDAQSILETLGEGYGGRLKLVRKYHQALEASVSKNFHGNEIIACMSQHTDCLYSAKFTAVMRASDDFFPRDPASHTIHIASVAYNTIFIGEFMQPDWDMFHSLHPMAEYHGAARGVGGCAIYVSDKPGQHDFNLLKKLVLPDGSVLRAKLPGRPTRDCLFSDPVRDGKSLLKIWNLNDFTGVLGVFNCQGAGWCNFTKKMLIHDEQPETVTGFVKANDVDHLHQAADGGGWDGDAIGYSHREGNVVYLTKKASVTVTLKPREYEVFTIVPVKQFAGGVRFAPIGLIEMFNSGGAIKDLKYETDARIHMKVRGCGLFGAYSSATPQRVRVDSLEAKFQYEEESRLVTIVLEVPAEELYLWSISIEL